MRKSNFKLHLFMKFLFPEYIDCSTSLLFFLSLFRNEQRKKNKKKGRTAATYQLEVKDEQHDFLFDDDY